GGRWNSPGVRVVYVSESLSLSVLEILVHLQTNVLLSSYVTFAVELPETVIEELPTAALPADWREFPAPPAVRALGDAWVARGSSAALRVPSAVLAMEHTYLLNPAPAEFVGLAVSGPEPLDGDARVFRRCPRVAAAGPGAYTVRPMSEPFRLGYLVPEFPRQTHVFFWRECEQLGRRGVEPVFLSTRKPPADACPHEFRDRAAAATHYVFPPPACSVISLFARPAGILRAVAYWLGLGGSAKDRLRHLGLIVCAAHLAGYCRKRGVTHIHIHSCGQSALLAAFAQRLGGPGY